MKTLSKNIIREFTTAPGRFIALLLIVILGAAFFTGLRSVAPSMRLTADEYFAGTQLADFRLMSDLGLTDGDVSALRARQDVAGVMPIHTADVFVQETHGVAICAIRSLPTDNTESNPDYLSRITLTEGRMPQSANECVADSWDYLKIGDVVWVTDENDQDTLDRFAQRSFTVVGLATSPTYISISRGNTTIGMGEINAFLYVTDAVFTDDYYTEIGITLNPAAELSAFSSDYAELIHAKTSELEAFGAGRAKIRYEEVQQNLADAQKKYDDAQSEADEKLSDAQSKIDKGQRELNQGEQTYTDKTTELINGTNELTNAQNAIASKRTELDNARNDLAYAKAEVDAKRTQLDGAKANLQTLNAQIVAGRTGLAGMRAQMDSLVLDPVTNAAAIAVLQGQMNALEAQIAAGESQAMAAAALIADGDAQLAEAYLKISAGEAQIQAGEQQLAQAVAQVADAAARIDSGGKELQDARKKLNDAARELVSGRSEYAQEKENAERELAEARAELDDVREKLERTNIPEWYVFTRDDNPGYSGFSADADRIGSLSVTITLLLYVVAALVCLTTMTRMVEEQRMQIGTLKALGYSRRVIQFKYFFYAAFIGLLGGAIGVAAGLLAFPQVIWEAYSMLYAMGDIHLSPTFINCSVGLLAGPAATVIATTFACGSELRSAAAELLRPKAPKAGKRVMLERVGFLWRRLLFSHKVTIRNLFRYKKRFLTTIIGVAGCCALLLTGFGLRDSISGIVTLQYEKISHAMITVFLDEGSSANEENVLNAKLANYGNYTYVHVNDADAEKGILNNKNMTTWLLVPEDPVVLNDFISFQERVSGKTVEFPPDPDASYVTESAPGDIAEPASAGPPPVVVTEKLAKSLGVQVGDTIDIAPATQKRKEVRVAGITEHYVYNYIYLTPESYTELFDAEPKYTTVMLMPYKTDDSSIRGALTDLISTDNVKSSTSTLQIRDILNDVMGSLNSIVWVIISVAGGLALVVLYNLTNINIIERERELATLKVLGFYRSEVSSYVNRESTILSLIGIALGLAAGVFLHRYVMTSVEVNEFMFGRLISKFSFVISGVFTLLCGIAVNLAMRPRILKIDPVSSLKSAE